MTPGQFKDLLNLVEQDITKETTNMREPIDAAQCLFVTFMFLATGDSVRILAMFFRSAYCQVFTSVRFSLLIKLSDHMLCDQLLAR